MACSLTSLKGDVIISSPAAPTPVAPGVCAPASCSPCVSQVLHQPLISFETADSGNPTVFELTQAFLWPQVGGMVTVPVPDSSLYKVGQGAYPLPGFGWMIITAIPSATSIQLTNQGSSQNSTPGTLVQEGTYIVVGVPEKLDLSEQEIEDAVESAVDLALPDAITDVLGALDTSAGPPIWPVGDVPPVQYGTVAIWDSSAQDGKTHLKHQTVVFPGISGAKGLWAVERDPSGSYVRFSVLDPAANEAGELVIIRKDESTFEPKPYIALVNKWAEASEATVKQLVYLEENYVDGGGSPRVRKKWRFVESFVLPSGWAPEGLLDTDANADGIELFAVLRVATPAGDRLYGRIIKAPADNSLIVSKDDNWRFADAGTKFTESFVSGIVNMTPTPDTVAANGEIMTSGSVTLAVPAGTTHALVRFRHAFLCNLGAADTAQDIRIGPSCRLRLTNSGTRVISEIYSARESGGGAAVRKTAFASGAATTAIVPLTGAGSNQFSWDLQYFANDYTHVNGTNVSNALYADLEGYYGPLL